MSPIGKVFIVLNLALAAMFVGGAAALINTGQDYRREAERLDGELTAANSAHVTEVSGLNSRLNQVTGEKDRLADAKTNLEGDKTALEAELKTEQEQNADLRERLTSIDGKLGDLESTNRQQETRIADLSGENRTLRGERDTALDERDAAFAERTEAVTNADSLTRERDELTIALGGANETISTKEAQLAQIVKLYKIDLSNISAQPDINGRVTSVDANHGTLVVVINRGTNDGVMAGHTFDVYNGGVYKGQIYIETVNSNQAAATLARAGNAPVAAGDTFTTSL